MPAAAASPPTTSARMRSGSKVDTISPWRSTATGPTSGRTSRIAVTASTPCSSAASRRSRNAAPSPASGDDGGDDLVPWSRRRWRRSRREETTAIVAMASAPTSAGPRDAARRPALQSPMPTATANPAPNAQAIGGRATRSTAPLISAAAAIHAQRHAPGVRHAGRAFRGSGSAASSRSRRSATPGRAGPALPVLTASTVDDGRALARPGAVRVELQRGRALQVEHLDDARAGAARARDACRRR